MLCAFSEEAGSLGWMPPGQSTCNVACPGWFQTICVIEFMQQTGSGSANHIENGFTLQHKVEYYISSFKTVIKISFM